MSIGQGHRPMGDMPEQTGINPLQLLSADVDPDSGGAEPDLPLELSSKKQAGLRSWPAHPAAARNMAERLRFRLSSGI